MRLENFINCADFQLANPPIKIAGGILIRGHFPYETARVHPIEGRRLKVPRIMADNIESAYPQADNKVVYICEDIMRLGTSNFAVFAHDNGCVFGTWEEVFTYDNKPLKQK